LLLVVPLTGFFDCESKWKTVRQRIVLKLHNDFSALKDNEFYIRPI
jgi:hypothetical protein